MAKKPKPIAAIPNVPWRVLTYRYPASIESTGGDPTWFAYSTEDGQFYDCDEDRVDSDYYEGKYHTYHQPYDVIVIEHPRNDPEALAIIAEAKAALSAKDSR